MQILLGIAIGVLGAFLGFAFALICIALAGGDRPEWRRRSGLLIALIATLGCTGCTVVCQNRVFPKLAWYWSDDAKTEREYSRQHKASEEAYRKSQQTNQVQGAK